MVRSEMQLQVSSCKSLSGSLSRLRFLQVNQCYFHLAAGTANQGEADNEEGEGEDGEYYQAGTGGRREQRRNEREARRLVSFWGCRSSISLQWSASSINSMMAT